MSIQLKDLVFQVTIDGREINFQQNILESFHAVESVRLRAPAITIVVRDTTQFFSKNAVLYDGAPVVVSLTVFSTKTVLKGRLFNTHELQAEGASSYRIPCYLDSVEYWNGTSTRILSGSVDNALSQVASACGLRYEGTQTNDSQLWIPANRRWSDFARTLVDHAYVNDFSCLQFGLTLDGVMRLVNATDLQKLPIAEVFSNTPEGGQNRIIDWHLPSKSGFFNVNGGYKHSLYEQTLFRETVPTTELTVRKNTTKLSVNADVVQQLGQGMVTHSTIDSGNVHENYSKAYYQNRRLAGLFSSGIEFTSQTISRASLLDAVDCQLSRPGVRGVASISGRYIITSKVYYLSNNSFQQKIEACRHGVNDRNSDGLVG